MVHCVLVFQIASSVNYAFPQEKKSSDYPYRGPLCLGGFCLEKTLPSERNLIQKYGSGLKLRDFRCYALPDQGAYVQFQTEESLPGRIVTVFVSDTPSCLSKTALPHPKTPFPIFQTREQLKLGDAKQKAMKIYGPPSSVRAGNDGLFKLVPYQRERQGFPFGDTALVYDGPSDDLIQGIVYIRKGRVAAIYISCSE